MIFDYRAEKTVTKWPLHSKTLILAGHAVYLPFVGGENYVGIPLSPQPMALDNERTLTVTFEVRADA